MVSGIWIMYNLLNISDHKDDGTEAVVKMAHLLSAYEEANSKNKKSSAQINQQPSSRVTLA